jgi:hypothetical protein
MKGVHDHLAFVMGSDKEEPGETEKKGQAVEENKGGKRRFLARFVRPVEPENLAQGNERNGAIAGMKEDSEKEGH